MITKFKIKVGDKVRVIAGRDKGMTGSVTQVFPKEERVVVDGANIRFKHIKPTRKGDKGQKIEFNAPLHISNVMVIDPKSEKPSRVGYTTNDKGIKVRITKKSGHILEK